VAVLSGSRSFYLPDGFNVADTNNRAGSSDGLTWKCFFDRFFGAGRLGLPVPSSGSATIPDGQFS
jgi:hypothetical protein